MQPPLSQFFQEEIKKDSIVALYAEEDEDNHGLPFFLGKVINVIDNSENDCDADKDDDESDNAPENVVEIHEYIQPGKKCWQTYKIPVA